MVSQIYQIIKIICIKLNWKINVYMCMSCFLSIIEKIRDREDWHKIINISIFSILSSLICCLIWLLSYEGMVLNSFLIRNYQFFSQGDTIVASYIAQGNVGDSEGSGRTLGPSLYFNESDTHWPSDTFRTTTLDLQNYPGLTSNASALLFFSLSRVWPSESERSSESNCF